METELKVIAVNKKTGTPYISFEVDEKMPHMSKVTTLKNTGIHYVYTDIVDVLPEKKQYLVCK
jgi:hypothetical protein